jgi:hypothetical protein
MSSDPVCGSVTGSGYPDQPEVLDLIFKFSDAVLADGFDEDELADEVPQLMSFAATFYLGFLRDEFNVGFTGFDDSDDRQNVLELVARAELEEENADELDLLRTFDDFCALFDEIGEGYSSEATAIYEGDIILLTYRLVEELAGWADVSGRDRLASQGAEAVEQMKRVVRWMNAI